MLNITGSSLKVNARNVPSSTTPKMTLPPVIKRVKPTRINNNLTNKTKILKTMKKQPAQTGAILRTVEPKPVLNVLDRATLLLNTPTNEFEATNQNFDQNGIIRIKFNHYNKEFPIKNSVLKWSDVDEIYCFSFIYKGHYRRDIQIVHNSTGKVLYTSNTDKTILREMPNGAVATESPINMDVENPPPGIPHIERDDLGIYFLGLCVNDSASVDSYHYRVDIEEDPIAGIGAEGLEIREGPIRRNHTGGLTGVGEKNSVNAITEQLKQMDIKDLHSQEALNLKEQRDLEDILYS